MDGPHYIVATPLVDGIDDDVEMSEAQRELHGQLLGYLPRLRDIDEALIDHLNSEGISPTIERDLLHLRHVCRHVEGEISGTTGLRPDRLIPGLEELARQRPDIDRAALDPRISPYPVIGEICTDLRAMTERYPELLPPAEPTEAEAHIDARLAELHARVAAIRARRSAEQAGSHPQQSDGMVR